MCAFIERIVVISWTIDAGRNGEALPGGIARQAKLIAMACGVKTAINDIIDAGLIDMHVQEDDEEKKMENLREIMKRLGLENIMQPEEEYLYLAIFSSMIKRKTN